MRKPDTPCSAGCGKLLYSGSTSAPPEKRRCLACRRAGIQPRPDLVAVVEPDEPPAVPVREAEPADRFGTRGARLWRDALAEPGVKLSPAERVLLEEACRLADRLDRLDDFLCGHGDVWLRFRARNEDGSVVRVVVDRALTEARQQADTLRGIVADLVRKRPAEEQGEPKESILDELARRRADRQQEASGS